MPEMRKWEADPPPRYAPKPDPAYRNELVEISGVAALMGYILQPWQKRVIAAATQYETDNSGNRHYLYREVLITVPRQSGKTTLIAPLCIYRALLNPLSQIYFSAQTGQYAGDFMKKLGSEYATAWTSELRAAFEFRRSNGTEGFQGTNGSIFQRFTRGAEAMHSKTPILVVNDEVWTLSREEGQELLGAIRPAQSTLGDNAQIWNLSTMGTMKSEYLNDLVDAGRAGTRESLAYFEWSLGDGLDPTDETLWETFHPALGNTQSLNTLRRDFSDLWPVAPGEWERAYCNRLTTTEDTALFPDFNKLPDSGEVPETICLAVETSGRTNSAVIIAAWATDTGDPAIAIVQSARLLNWIPAALQQVIEAHPDTRILIDDSQVNARAIDLMTAAEIEFEPIKIKQRHAADAALIEAAADTHTLHHDHSDILTESAAGAVTRTYNGAVTIDRAKSETDPAAIIAASVAVYGLTHEQAAEPPLILV